MSLSPIPVERVGSTNRRNLSQGFRTFGLWSGETSRKTSSTALSSKPRREWRRLRAIEMAAIAEKRARKTHLQDGYRSIVDWVAARADVSHKTARSLCWTATRCRPRRLMWLTALADGEITFDRAEQVSRLPEATSQRPPAVRCRSAAAEGGPPQASLAQAREGVVGRLPAISTIPERDHREHLG